MTACRPFKEIQQCAKCLQTSFSIRHSSTRATRLEGDDYLTYTCNVCGYAFNTQAADCVPVVTVVAEFRDVTKQVVGTQTGRAIGQKSNLNSIERSSVTATLCDTPVGSW